MEKYNILIIGAGAIGGSIATRLSLNEAVSITVLELNPELKNKINKDGMILKDFKQTLVSKNVVAVDDIANLTENYFDFCFSATRAYHLKTAVSSVLPFLKEDSLVVSLNNGICLDALIDVVGIDRAVGCAINFGAGISGLGEYYTKIKGDIVLGMKREVIPDKLTVLSNLIKPQINNRTTNNIYGELFSKMLINSCITSSALLTGLPLGKILKTKDGIKLFDNIIKEGIFVANAMKIKVPPYKNKINYYSLLKDGIFNALKRKLCYLILKLKYGKRESATLAALKNGVRSETDFYNGYISRMGKKYGIRTTTCDKVCQLIKEIEKDQSLICYENLKTAISKD